MKPALEPEATADVSAAAPLRSAQILQRIPRVSAQQWHASTLPARWLIAVRAAVLVLTLAAAGFGGLLALHHALVHGTGFDALAWLLCCIGLLLAHASNNLLNDLTDSVRGIDDDNYFRTHYGTHVLEHGLLDLRGLLGYLALTGGSALVIGLFLLWRTGPVMLTPLLAGAFCLLFYTWPLKQWGLGEIAVLLVWGPLMVVGTHVVASGSVDAGGFDPGIIAAGILFGIGPTLVIFGKHIDKIELDTVKGVRTLPVRLGERRARSWVVALTLFQYPLAVGLVILGVLPWPILMIFASLPGAVRLIRMYRLPRPETCPEDWPADAWPLWFVASAFVHARATALALLLGMLAAVALAAATPASTAPAAATTTM